jgi:hypothetical protein
VAVRSTLHPDALTAYTATFAWSGLPADDIDEEGIGHGIDLGAERWRR